MESLIVFADFGPQVDGRPKRSLLKVIPDITAADTARRMPLQTKFDQRRVPKDLAIYTESALGHRNVYKERKFHFKNAFPKFFITEEDHGDVAFSIDNLPAVTATQGGTNYISKYVTVYSYFLNNRHGGGLDN